MTQMNQLQFTPLATLILLRSDYWCWSWNSNYYISSYWNWWMSQDQPQDVTVTAHQVLELYQEHKQFVLEVTQRLHQLLPVEHGLRLLQALQQSTQLQERFWSAAGTGTRTYTVTGTGGCPNATATRTADCYCCTGSRNTFRNSKRMCWINNNIFFYGLWRHMVIFKHIISNS